MLDSDEREEDMMRNGENSSDQSGAMQMMSASDSQFSSINDQDSHQSDEEAGRSTLAD